MEGPDQDVYSFHPIDMPWLGPLSHSAAASVILADAPPGIVTFNLQHLQWPGLWYCAGHPGSTAWCIRPNYSNREQYHRPGLLPQQVGINVVYSPTITTAAGGKQRQVGMVVQERPQGWIIELTHFHGSKVVSCEVVACGKRTLLVGAYLPPSTLDHFPELEDSLKYF